jgi:hypothetical protein
MGQQWPSVFRIALAIPEQKLFQEFCSGIFLTKHIQETTRG